MPTSPIMIIAALSLLSCVSCTPSGSDTDEEALPVSTMHEELRSYIEMDLRAGFSTTSESTELAVEILSDDYDVATLQTQAWKIGEEVQQELIEEEKGWPDITDCDRLDRAFEDLEQRGIVARQNFSCCGTCGAGEIWDEMQTQIENGRARRGYTFYHVQDTESAADGYGLYLSYGAAHEAPIRFEAPAH